MGSTKNEVLSPWFFIFKTKNSLEMVTHVLAFLTYKNAAYLIFGHGSKGFDNGCQRHFALLCKVSSARERICCAPHESWASIPLK